MAPGITPGSGPGTSGCSATIRCVASIGRGVLEALGIDFDLRPADVAARGNFCTVGPDGAITDRRAGRISTDVCRTLVDKLRTIRLEVELFLEPVRDYRFVLVLRGDRLGAEVDDTDPGRTGEPPIEPQRCRIRAHGGAVAGIHRTGRRILEDDHPANMITLRGIARRPPMPAFDEVYKLRAAAIATYPMYRGLARLVGMTILPAGGSWAEQVDRLHESWRDYDFFFLHYKYTVPLGRTATSHARSRASRSSTLRSAG